MDDPLYSLMYKFFMEKELFYQINWVLRHEVAPKIPLIVTMKKEQYFLIYLKSSTMCGIWVFFIN